MPPQLPGPEERLATSSALELKTSGLADNYANRIPAALDDVDMTKPFYIDDVWVRTITPPLLFSDSNDRELSPGIGGVTPLSRTYMKVNIDMQRYYGMTLEPIIRHEQGHLDEPEPQLPLYQQEDKTYYLYGP